MNYLTNNEIGTIEVLHYLERYLVEVIDIFNSLYKQKLEFYFPTF